MKENKYGITVGGDPEFFIMDAGEPIPAFEYIPGTKDKPHKLPCGYCQVDGMAVEVNIDPAKSAEEFTDNIHGVLREVRKLVPMKYDFGFQPSVYFHPLVLEKAPEENKILGCSPDWNAYTGLQNPNPIEKLTLTPTMRSAGGHLAIGWGSDFDKTDASHIFDCELVIKTIDPFYMNSWYKWDGDTKRAELYGKPGAYRPTSFGVEYRTPSNAWLKYPGLYPFMFDLAVATMISVIEGKNEIEPPVYKPEMILAKRAD